MRSELARVRRYGGCLTLVMLDLNRFKAYNDSHGHGAGNRLLASVGHVLAREKRDADIAARFGGEEFALLVPGRGTEAIVVAERVRQAIADIPLGALDRHHVPDIVTASAGIATFPVDARDAEELFEQADRGSTRPNAAAATASCAPSTSARTAAGSPADAVSPGRRARSRSARSAAGGGSPRA
jgi:diguanylate cyclase (GGDEF)-like protein